VFGILSPIAPRYLQQSDPQQAEVSALPVEAVAGSQQPGPQAQSLHVQFPSLQQSLPQQADALRVRNRFLRNFMVFSLCCLS
jgi:hypothetical protein